MKQRIAQITLLVKDYDEAINFYTQKLSFTLIEDSLLGEEKRWVRIAPPGTGELCLLLSKAKTAEQLASVGNQAGGRVFLFLFTDNFDRDYDKMLKNKVKFLTEPVQQPYGKVVVFEDLYGNRYDLLEPIDETV